MAVYSLNVEKRFVKLVDIMASGSSQKVLFKRIHTDVELYKKRVYHRCHDNDFRRFAKQTSEG